MYTTQVDAEWKFIRGTRCKGGENLRPSLSVGGENPAPTEMAASSFDSLVMPPMPHWKTSIGYRII